MTGRGELMTKAHKHVDPRSTAHVARGGAELRSDLGIARDLASHGFILGENKRNFLDVSADIMAHIDPIFYDGAAKTAAMKVPGGSVPISLIELSSQVILHKFNSPAWLKHIQKANAALGSLTPEKMANLRPGEAFVWSSKATDDAFTKSAVKIRCRPRVTHHGGATKTAVGGH